MERAAIADTAPRIAIVIPAFNEEAVVGNVVAAVRKCVDYPIIVIDDCSTDGTRRVASTAGAIVIPLPAQLGAWGATQTGIRYALRHDFDVVLTMDADGQHEPCWFPVLLAPILAGHADVAIGACTQRGSVLRQIAWVLMKSTSGLRLEDVTSGFRAYNRTALVTLSQWQATLLDYQDIGVLLLLESRGLEIHDIPVTMRERQAGASRVFHSWLMVVYYMLHTLLLGFTKRRITKKRPIERSGKGGERE